MARKYPWSTVARTEEIERVQVALAQCRPGPVVITGEPGMGRTSLLDRVLDRVAEGDAVARVAPTGGRLPFSALAPLLPDGPPRAGALRERIVEVARTLALRVAGKRLVVAVDDAHLADPESMQALRELHRGYGAVLLVTVPCGADLGSPDSLDCLRYERGTQTLRLPPLSVDEVGAVLATALGGPVRQATTAALHAAAGGNPRLLRDLVELGGLAERVVERDGSRQLGPGPDGPPLDGRGARRLLAAVDEAWRDLALDRADELCLLAAGRGLGAEVAVTWAGVLLLRERPEEGLAALDAADAEDPRARLVRALLLSLGQGQVARACAELAEAAREDGPHRARLLAYRAWILAVAGRMGEASHALVGPPPRGDREAAAFAHAAHARVLMSTGRANEAVSHLRRAVVAMESLRPGLPWLPPYLTACLIDGLLLAGRITEATAAAADFHAGRQGCGWSVAVSLSTLIGTCSRADAPAAAGAGGRATTGRA